MELKEKYIQALLREMEIRKDFLQGAPIQTLYFGGGTPSLLTTEELEMVISQLHKHHHFSKDLEFTLEANPDQLSIDYLKKLKSLGINRLSIGIQSFDNTILTLLGRTHDSETAKAAIENALTIGFDNLSIDLIYGISARGKGQWEKDVLTACHYPISHLSCYSLTVEENTLLNQKIKNGQIQPIDDDLSVNDFWTLLRISREEGFEQYEISNFARNQKISKHNFSYWTDTPYLGMGASAHSYNGLKRSWNTSNIKQYIDSWKRGERLYEEELLSLEDHFNEYVLLGLRTYKGINLNEIEQRFGTRLKEQVRNCFQKIDANLFYQKENTYILSDIGKLNADHIAMLLFETKS